MKDLIKPGDVLACNLVSSPSPLYITILHVEEKQILYLVMRTGQIQDITDVNPLELRRSEWEHQWRFL